MNCANHADASAVAYCRTCGKALCANCTRPVKGVIYCEDCLGAKMEGKTPPGAAAFVPGAPGAGPAAYPPGTPAVSAGPNPALAGILAGFFPFGVGPVYTGQYAKGLAHLIIFGLLIAGCSASDNSEVLGIVCGVGLAFFYVYQIIDSVRSARALQMGQAPPDPFGLAHTFTAGDKIDTKKIPAGAVLLILIGVLFLLHTLGIWEYGIGRFWPVILIALGGWTFARNFGLVAPDGSAPDPHYRSRALMGPAMLTSIGILFLLSELRVANFGRTWPILLLVIGGVKLLQSSAVGLGPTNPPGPGVGPTGGDPNVPPAPPSEVSHG